MVNYCIVYGCGRNSRINTQLNFFSLPKEKTRQEQWLRAAGREDLLSKITDDISRRLNYRICSKHFTPLDISNKHLIKYAVPQLYLPGNPDNAFTDESEEELEHQSIVCNSCSKPITGFRYKCVACEDYDLCPKCENMEVHSLHFMLRIPKPMKFKLADNMIQKWKQFYKEENKGIPTSSPAIKINNVSDSSDDEPITKYARSCNSVIHLSEDVKSKIQREVARAVAHAEAIEKENIQKMLSRSKKRKRKPKPHENKCISHVATQTDFDDLYYEIAEDLVFADVNELHTTIDLDVKTEIPNYFVSGDTNIPKTKDCGTSMISIPSK